MRELKRLDGALAQRAENVIAGGALTNSKRPESFVKNVYPQHLVKGQGAYVFDTYNNKYIDFIGGLGANILGHAEEEVVQAISQRAKMGTALSLGTDLEVKCAEKVKELFPFIERLRFLKTGSEATHAAVIIARAFTNRNMVLTSGYHSWMSEFTSLTPPAYGCPASPFITSLHSLEQINGNTAAVIVEPVVVEFTDERRVYLENLRKKCTETGTILIFDEIITGGRFSNYSVSREWDIIPDLICMGKAIGGGMPLAIVAGSKNVMTCDYFVSSTFAGETLSLAASLKTMELLQTKYKLPYLWEKGAQFLFKFNEIWREGLTLKGYPTRSTLMGETLTKALFMQECCKAGILIGPSPFFSFPHIQVMDEALSIFTDILGRIKTGSIALDGEMPKSAFSQRVREMK